MGNVASGDDSNSIYSPPVTTNNNNCKVCGGPRGKQGAMGDPGGHRGLSGFLGPCGHEESRGNRGVPGKWLPDKEEDSYESDDSSEEERRREWVKEWKEGK